MPTSNGAISEPVLVTIYSGLATVGLVSTTDKPSPFQIAKLIFTVHAELVNGPTNVQNCTDSDSTSTSTTTTTTGIIPIDSQVNSAIQQSIGAFLMMLILLFVFV